MKLIRLYSFRCPTAKSLPLGHKSTLPPSSQVFANGLLSPPPAWQKEYELFQEHRSKLRLRLHIPWRAEGQGVDLQIYLGLFTLPQKSCGAQGLHHPLPKSCG